MGFGSYSLRVLLFQTLLQVMLVLQQLPEIAWPKYIIKYILLKNKLFSVSHSALISIIEMHF